MGTLHMILFDYVRNKKQVVTLAVIHHHFTRIGPIVNRAYRIYVLKTAKE